jgi:hypothetical protein
MSKRPSLAAALHEAGAKPAAAQSPATVAALIEPKVAPPVEKTGNRPPSRAGLRAVTVYVSADMHASLVMLCLEKGKQEKRKVPVQELGEEAFVDLLRKYGRAAGA